MRISAEEIASILEKEIVDFKKEMDVSEVGEVIQVGDGIARIYGLENVMSSELVEFPNGVFGMALNLEEDNVGCVLMGDDELVRAIPEPTLALLLGSGLVGLGVRRRRG